MNRYTHKEAFTLHFLKKCDRISQIHEAGLHGQYAVIVMDQFGVLTEQRRHTDDDLTVASVGTYRHMTAFTGAHFILNDKPRFREVQVCKVISDILEALLFLNDRHMAHLDISLKNILVDRHLRAQLIDFDQCRLATDDGDFRRERAQFVYAREDHMSPELLIAINLYAPEGIGGEPREQKDIAVDYDIRDEQLWKFACMIFELLHGYAPFTDLEQLARNHRAVIRAKYDNLSESDERKDRARRRDRRYRRQRRDRILNAPLQFAEEVHVIIPPVKKGGDTILFPTQLTQDALDVMQAMFMKDRADRPSVEELAAFPWFQGSYEDRDFRFSYPPAMDRKLWKGPWPTDFDQRPSDSI